MRKIEVYHLNKTDLDHKTTTVDFFPDKCPRCNQYQDPHFITSCIRLDYRMFKSPEVMLQAVFKCHNRMCDHIFISDYNKRPSFSSNADFNYSRSYPIKTIEEDSVSEEIKEISPKYKEILHQSKQAEEHSLDKIAGVGYRKALEFLIKDYLIKFKNWEESQIKAKLLGKCISEHIENETIKELARKTSWVGNDETHYERKHEEKTIKDLKELLELTAHWITYEIKTKNQLDSFSTSKAPN